MPPLRLCCNSRMRAVANSWRVRQTRPKSVHEWPGERERHKGMESDFMHLIFTDIIVTTPLSSSYSSQRRAIKEPSSLLLTPAHPGAPFPPSLTSAESLRILYFFMKRFYKKYLLLLLLLLTSWYLYVWHFKEELERPTESTGASFDGTKIRILKEGKRQTESLFAY